MAFLRRKGNSYYLVHNVRQRGKVRQIHLARLGDRPRITDEVVRQVTRQHPFLLLARTYMSNGQEASGFSALFEP